MIKGHSIVKLSNALGINGELKEAGMVLDQYYISTRYPDALPAGAPFEFFTKSQAEAAIIDLAKFNEIARKELRI